MDTDFLVKFMLCVDDRIHQWLHQCCTAKIITDTEVRLLDFREICLDIQVQRFFYDIPASVKTLDLSNDSKDDTNGPGNGKKPKQDKGQTKLIKNTYVLGEVKLRENESWDTIFRGKSGEGPTLSFGGPGCCKYPTKGICFDDCTIKASHKHLNAADFKLYCGFVKKLRGE